MEKIALLCILMTSILAASSWTDVLGSDHIRQLMMRGRNNGNLLARRMMAFDLDPYAPPVRLTKGVINTGE